MGRERKIQPEIPLLKQGAENLGERDFLSLMRPHAMMKALFCYEVTERALATGRLALRILDDQGDSCAEELALSDALAAFSFRGAVKRLICIAEEFRKASSGLFGLLESIPWLLESAHQGFKLFLTDDLAAELTELRVPLGEVEARSYYSFEWIFKKWTDLMMAGVGERVLPAYCETATAYYALIAEADRDPNGEARNALEQGIILAHRENPKIRDHKFHGAAKALNIMPSKLKSDLQNYRCLMREKDAVERVRNAPVAQRLDAVKDEGKFLNRVIELIEDPAEFDVVELMASLSRSNDGT